MEVKDISFFKNVKFKNVWDNIGILILYSLVFCRDLKNDKIFKIMIC